MRSILFATWFIGAPAFAACPAPISQMDLLNQTTQIQQALRGADDEAAYAKAKVLHDSLPCVDGVIKKQIVGPVYRAIAMGFLSGKDATAEAWVLAAVEASAAYDFEIGELAADHPGWDEWPKAKNASTSRKLVPGMAFVEGQHYLDGNAISKPEATEGHPHLFQSKSDPVKTWLIDGAGFPQDVLTGAAAVVVADVSKEKVKRPKKEKAPKNKAVKPPKDKPVKPPKDKPEKAVKDKPVKPPKDGKSVSDSKQAKINEKNEKRLQRKGKIKRKVPERIPLLVGGGLTIGASGALYYISGQHRQKFDSVDANLQTIESEYKKTNQMVVYSGIAAGVGAGLLGWGIAVTVNDTGKLLPGIHVRW